jgi:hypothetical protein
MDYQYIIPCNRIPKRYFNSGWKSVKVLAEFLASDCKIAKLRTEALDVSPVSFYLLIKEYAKKNGIPVKVISRHDGLYLVKQ